MNATSQGEGTEMHEATSTPATRRRGLRRHLALIGGLAGAAALALAFAAPAAAAPAYQVHTAGPSHVDPAAEPNFDFGGFFGAEEESVYDYWIQVENVGDAATSGDIELDVTLPEGLTAFTAGVQGGFACFGPLPFPIVPFASEFSCTRSSALAADAGSGSVSDRRSLFLVVDPEAPLGEAAITIEVSGGGAGEATTYVEPITIGPPADYGAYEFGGLLADGQGRSATQAGSHPDEMTTTIRLNTARSDAEPGSSIAGHSLPAEQPKTFEANLPPGLVGDPTATPTRCSRHAFILEGASSDEPPCPASSQVGIVTALNMNILQAGRKVAVYNLVPPPGRPAQFGFRVSNVVTFLTPSVRTGGDYGVTATARNVSQATPILKTAVTLWGVPADPSHDPERGECARTAAVDSCPLGAPPKPFLTLPTRCSAEPLVTSLRTDSWQSPGVFDTASFDHDRNGNPVQMEGCELVPFDPEISIEPTKDRADSPTGLEVELSMPQNENPEGLAQAHLKRAEVTLPEGMAVNPAAADGLAACTEAEIGLDDASSPDCPDASRLGTVRVETPLLEEPMEGHVYQAAQGDNPFDSLLAIYIVAEGPGVVVKLPGEVSPDPDTGQLTATFDDNPQLPFETFRLRFNGGPRAPLVTPATCGTHSWQAEFSPWSAADPDNPTAAEVVSESGTFEVSEGCDASGFSPEMSAGTVSPLAGEFSPLVTRFTRADGEEAIKRLTVALPEGLSGKLAGIPYCSEAALSAFGSNGITDPGTAAGEIADSTCPAESQVGRVTVGAGAGSSPFYLQTGKAYLAGPHDGAPLSLAIVTAAKAGPFDLGTVLVRSALHVNERTAQITVQSDDIPRILEGIPLKLRDIRVLADREEFTLNPTNCEATKVWALARGTGNTHANLASDFQVTNCAALDFEPRFGMQVLNPGRRSTLRSFNPAMRFTVAPRPGDANLGPAQVILPSSVILDQSNIRTICTRDQFADRLCPDASVYGFARAWSPLLDEPLIGPVILGSSDNPLPDIIADLRGQVDVTLQGQIDSVRPARGEPSGESRGARMRNTFRVVPDVPVSRFQLTMFGGRNRGVLVNSRDLCTSTERGVALFQGQNGKLSLQRPGIRTAFRGCREVRRLEVRRTIRRRAVIRKALSSGSLTPSQARRQIRS